MEQSLFIKKEGSAPKNKVLDFLITVQDFDYSLKDIAIHSDVSYPAVKQLKKTLARDNWIVLTRRVGKAQMYKLNVQSKKVQKFVDFYWSVVNEEVEQLPEFKKTISPSFNAPIAIPASSKQM